MPKYRVEVDGGTYEVESDTELSDEEAIASVQGQQQSSTSPNESPLQSARDIKASDSPLESMRSSLGISRQQQDPNRYGKYYDDPNVGNQNALQQFGTRTGRRVGEAVDSALSLPQNALDTITGGGENGRIGSAFSTLSGIASPFSAVLAPIEAASEEALAGFGMSEDSARLGGSLTGAIAGLGAGLISKTGKLGPLAQQVAEFLGVGKIGSLEETIKTDPQFEWAATRKQDKIRPLEEAIRSDASMSELGEMAALQLKSPELAQIEFNKRIAQNDVYFEFAKANKIMDELPPAPRFEPTPGVVFDGINKLPDAGIFGSLGSPVREAAALNPRAADALLELAKTEMSIQQGILARGKRTQDAVIGVGAEDLRKAILMRADTSMTHGDKMLLPEAKFSAGAKKALQFMEDKIKVDVQVALPRLREKATEYITPIVEREFGIKSKAWQEPPDKSLIALEVQRRVKEQFPDTYAADQLLPGIFPGYYKIMDKDGVYLGSANNRNEALVVIHDLAQSRGLKNSGDFRIDHKSYFDGDTLRMFKGPVEQTYKRLSDAMAVSPAGIDAAIAGKFGFAERYKFLDALFQKPKNNAAYTKDFFTLWNTWDRTMERFTQLDDLSRKVVPVIKQIAVDQPKLAERVSTKMSRLYGRRLPLSELLDNSIASIPVLRDIVAPQILESLVTKSKIGMVNLFLKYSFRYQAVNSTQTLSTLYPIAKDGDLFEAAKLLADPAGQKLLQKHGILGMDTKVEGISKGQGFVESKNQQGAFLTMYNFGRKQGLTDAQAADYGKARGNVYSQFFGLTSDQPHAFNSDPTGGLLTMFMRFPIKQTEQFLDIVKGRNYPGAAKWLGVNLALGGMKAATMGGAGWLGYDTYKKIQEQYGQGWADVIHHGLPALAGIDVSNSIRMIDAPFGESVMEKATNLVMGPAIGTGYSIMQSVLDKDPGLEPDMKDRAFNAMISRVPLFKQADALGRLFTGDYDFNDPSGRLKFKAETKDVVRRILGFKSSGGQMGVVEGPNQMKESELEQFASGLLEIEAKRQSVIGYAAARYGQAGLAGIDLGSQLEEQVKKEVYNWNERWPEFPITGTDIQKSTQAKMKSAMQSLGERLLKGSPAALRHSPAFQPIEEPDTNQESEEGSSFLAPGGG